MNPYSESPSHAPAITHLFRFDIETDQLTRRSIPVTKNIAPKHRVPIIMSIDEISKNLTPTLMEQTLSQFPQLKTDSSSTTNGTT